MLPPPPERFLDVIIEVDREPPTLLGLCAGYEFGKWRSQQFAEYLIEHLIEFVYPLQKWSEVTAGTAHKMLKEASIKVYTTSDSKHRGEIGELILYAILRSYYKSLPLISKIYFKDAANDVVKGFDAVHVIEQNDKIELWLGEAKFYTDASGAINDAVKSVNDHLSTDYLRKEFVFIKGKLVGDGTISTKLNKLLSEKTSLDEVFPCIHIPVLIAYESPVVKRYNKSIEAYKNDVTTELKRHFDKFKGSGVFKTIHLHLIFVPLHTKADLISQFDAKLKALQS
ncbi:MAG: DUF1837 domain-containing protein [Magnetococcales bacterium]|nr:DUF1837 domain-containing protein [Magnetococcales bacterium]